MLYADDQRLHAAFQAGEPEALAALFRRHRDDAFALCCRLVNEDVADDLLQETFLRVWRYRRSFSGRSKFSTWLYTIARNVCFDYLRADGRDRAVRDVITREIDSVEESAVHDWRPRTDTALHAAIAALAPDAREALVLTRFHGLSCREVAEVCGCSEGAVKQRVHRALRSLRRALSGEESPRGL